MKGSVFNFSGIASRYDAWYDNPVGAAYDRLEKNIIAELLPPAAPGATLLEVGCGTGHWSAWFHDRGYDVTGIDISPDMLREAAKKNIQGARFIQGDILDMHLDGQFDAVAAITSLEFMTDPEKALAKMALRVKPGGTLIIGVLNRHSWLGLKRKLKGAKDPVFHKARFFTMGEIHSLLGSHGTPVVTGGAFLFPWRPLLWSAYILEKTGRRLCPCLGNFIAAKVII